MKYTTIFSSNIRPVVSEEKDKYLALASAIEVAEFIPEVNEKQVDLLPVAFNAFVANRVNKNGDVVDTDTALAFYKDFKNKPINIEHNRDRVIGTILTAGFSEFGTDKPMTEEEIKEVKGPFNVTLGGVIWKVVNQRIADAIEESGDPSSEDYMKISASWELGFKDYNLVLLEGSDKNIENGLIVDNEDDVASMEKDLKALGGEGRTKDGMSVYRKVIGEVVPLGIGLTETPAADVKGVSTNKTVEEPKEEKTFAEVENTSQNAEKTVIIQNEEKTIMKIESIKDITNDSLKELSASAVSDFIESELKEASERFSAEKAQVESNLKEAQEKIEAVTADYDKIKAELDSVAEKLGTLETEKAEKEAEELFSQRMASLDEKYALEAEDREVLATQIKDLDSEGWDAFAKNIEVLLRDKSREVLAKKEDEASKEVEVEEESKASEEVVDEAIERGEQEESSIPASTQASEATTYDKYKKAFEIDQFDINY